MSDPIEDYIKNLQVYRLLSAIKHGKNQAGLSDEVVRSLKRVLDSKLEWSVPEGVPARRAGLWTANADEGRWMLVLFTFSIENQPDQQKGAMGYNVTLTYLPTGLVIMSDGKPQHDLAKALYDRMTGDSAKDGQNPVKDTGDKDHGR